MGLFDSMCLESGLIIDDKQALLPIIETPSGWVPLAVPIAGTNDRGGTMDVPRKLDANMKAFVAFAKQFVEAKDLGEVLDEIRGDGPGASYEGKAVSFALFDLDVYRAIVKAVGAGSATAWKRFAQRALQQPPLPLPHRDKKKTKAPKLDATTKRLAEEILAKPDEAAARKVLVDHLLERGDPLGTTLSMLPALGKLSADKLAAVGLPATTAVYGKKLDDHKDALRDLVRFLAWGTVLGPSYGEGQIFGYQAEDADDDGAAQPYTERARKAYAGIPELLAICDRNEKAFRAREDDGDDDDDDDDDDDE